MAMKFDKKMKFIKKARVPDGMGGWLPEQDIVLDEIDVFTTPVKAEIMLKEYGVVSTTSFKVFTKSLFPNEALEVYLEDANHSYKILQYSDLGKLRIMLVEVIR